MDKNNKRITYIEKFVEAYSDAYPAEESRWKHPLQKSVFSLKDKSEAIESILTTFVTMGSKVKEFENTFADWFGMKHGIMVNSGSSANLILAFLLKEPKFNLSPGDEIITPAFSWSTSLFPLIQADLKPIAIDCELDTFNVSAKSIEMAITKNTKAIFLVHLLGIPCDMTAITKLAKENGLILVEDSCESHGATWNDQKVGSFGDFSTFSFFFSHHITTAEGGIILTNDQEDSDMIRSLRAHGWIRDMSNYEEIAGNYPEIDKRFLFNHVGFNLRPTDIVAGLGINQIPLLDKIVNARRANHFYWVDGLKDYDHLVSTVGDYSKGRISPFVFPLTIREPEKINRSDFQNYLEENFIETRSVVAGNLLNQPFAENYKDLEKRFPLNNADFLMRNSFFWGNNHLVTEVERSYVLEKVCDYLDKI